MLRKQLPAWLLILMTIPLSAMAQDWSRYMPEKQRKDILKKGARTTGVGTILIKTSSAGIYWVTEPVARALVSQMVDKERLTNEEADARYQKLRRESDYSFAIYTVSLAMQSPFARPKTVGETVDPLGKSDFFLQRTDNRKVFSKAEISNLGFDLVLGGPQVLNTYQAILSKKDRSGVSIVRDLNDKIEVQFSLAGKTVILEYKVKELVSRLEDL